MPRAPRPLPSELGEQFRYADGRAAGVSRKRLRARDLEAPFRGVRRLAAPGPATDEGPLARDRMLRARVLRDARAYAEVMAPHAFFAGRTAAVLYGLPVRHTDELEVAVFAPARAPRRVGIRGRKVARGFATVRVLEGLPLASPASCWAMLGTELSERDVIRLGDAIVRIPRGEGGLPHPDLQLATSEELRAAALEPGRPGRTRLVRALAHIRVGSMSPLETDTRLESLAADSLSPSSTSRSAHQSAVGSWGLPISASPRIACSWRSRATTTAPIGRSGRATSRRWRHTPRRATRRYA